MDKDSFPDDFSRKPFKIGHKQHPVSRFVPNLLAKPLFSRPDLWFMGTRGDRVVVTYCPNDRTLAYYRVSLAKFKDLAMANSLPRVEKVVTVPRTVEWIGTIIHRDLSVFSI